MMKKIVTMLALLGTMSVGAFASETKINVKYCQIAAPVAYNLAAYYDIKDKDTALVVTHPLGNGPIKNVILVGDLDVLGFAGFEAKSGRAIAGAAVGKTWALAPSASLFTGVGFRATANAPVSGGPLLALNVSF